MQSPEFDDFSYPGADEPSGVIEWGVGDDVLAAIRSAAIGVGLGLGDRRMDCFFGAKAWYDTLRSHHWPVELLTGWGEHTDTIPPTPPDQVGGYRTDDDGVVRHWWLALSVERLIFDPTAHQFDVRGGVSLSRYLYAGRPFDEWRSTRLAQGSVPPRPT